MIEILFDKEKLSYYEQTNPALGVFVKEFACKQQEIKKNITMIERKLNDLPF